MNSAPLPLAGVRVLECAEGLSGPLAGWLLAEAGADVVKVEPPLGDRFRGALGFRALNRGKSSAVVDLEDDEQRERLRRLMSAADVVVVDEGERRLESRGLGYDARRSPALIWCSVTAWERQGPRAGLPTDDALVAAATGLSVTQWSYGKTPVHLVTPMATYAAGFLAALGITAAVHARARSGRGQRVDTSAAAGAMLLQAGSYVTGPGHEGSFAAQADDPRGVFPTYGLYATRDDWIFVGALTEAFWVKLTGLLGREDLLADPELAGSPMAFSRGEVRARLRRELEPIFATRPAAEWIRLFEEHDVPIGRVQTRREFLDEPHAAAIGAVVEIDDPEVGPVRQPGTPIVFGGRRASLEPAPPLDPNSEAGFGPRARTLAAAGRKIVAPLDGIRVLDLTSFIAGPLCPMLLADLGADVVKIEAPGGDPFRIAQFGFEGWNRGKRSLVLDLRKAEGHAAFERLAERADVVVENFRPGVMKRLGLDFAALAARNPRLVYVEISGFGAEGPESAKPGFDPVMQARSGFSSAQGGDDEPVLHQIAYTDYMTGTLAAFGTIAALVERETTGRGGFVDASLYRTAFAMQAAELVECGGRMPETRGGRDLLGESALRRFYACRDGWLCLAATTVEHAAAIVEAFAPKVDPEELLVAPLVGRVADALVRVFATRPREACLATLARAGVPAAPALSFAEVFGDPHLRANRLIRDSDHPRLGKVEQTGEIIHLALTPMVFRRPGPALGEHGREVLSEAGFSEAEIDALVRAGGTSA